MNDKKFVGNAKSLKYGFIGTLNLNQLLKYLYEESGEMIFVNILKKVIDLKEKESEKYPYLNLFESDNKKVVNLKIIINKFREPKEWGTHYMALNEFVPEKKQHVEEDHVEEDMPF